MMIPNFSRLAKAFTLFFICISGFTLHSQSPGKQKGLLWQISGNGLKKPSYVYGTMHVSQKIAFHLGDSFYIALSKADVVALEQNLDSVIHRWISESESENPEDANKVYPRSSYDFLNLFSFTLNSYNKALIQRKLSAEAREVNYLLTRGEQDDFEEDAWLDLYIYQIAKKLGKEFTGVEGYEESRELVRKSQKEPKDGKKKIPQRFNYKLRQQIADAYRRGDIFMLDSIDRMTESEHYLEFMLYKRNANMVRRMDSIMRLGKTMFTGVGCSHLPGSKGVLQMLLEKGYTVRPVQSIALEKSKMAKKYEQMQMKHRYSMHASEDGLISAMLPTRLTKVNDNSFYSSYLSPDLANGYYYQIEKIACNTVFSGKSPQDILMVIDTMIFENIPGEITDKKSIVSNGFQGMEVVTRLKTGDLNRFQILASPFNVYIIRMSARKNFAVSSEANAFFKSLRINEGKTGTWQTIISPDSIFSIDLPHSGKENRLSSPYKAVSAFEHQVYYEPLKHTYLIKQEDLLNEHYLEHDSFELNVMARSFAATDNFKTLSHTHFNWQGYNALETVFENKGGHKMYARFVVCGTRYILFVLKPENDENRTLGDYRFFLSIHFNGKPAYRYFDYKDTALYFKVKTPVLPLLTRKQPAYATYYFEDGEEDDTKVNTYKGQFNEVYFKPDNANEFISVSTYRYGYYESQNKNKTEYFKSWEKKGSLKLLEKKQYNRNGVDYYTFTYTDTNTTRRFKVLHALHGKIRYYIEAYLDTVSGSSDFVETFFNTFDVSDTIVKDDIFAKKGQRFFNDFVSRDSVIRKAAIRNFAEVTFERKDIPGLCNIIDSISMKGDAAELRSEMIKTLSGIDSASAIVIPYLQKLYSRFSDTAHMQIEILQAMASQRNDIAFNAIKPILASDIPISDNAYDMRQMLYAFSDSLKLTRIILPELIELTGIPEYRNTAYRMISRLKDSGIITELDYAAIHDKLVRETRIEYKRLVAAITGAQSSNTTDNSYLRSGMNLFRAALGKADKRSYTLLSDMLDLSLPLRQKNNTIQDIVSRILKITDNDIRLSLLPVLIKYKIDFHDTVYQALAKNRSTRIAFYKVLAEAKHLSKFPKAYLNHREWVLADIYANNTEYSKVDSIEQLQSRQITIGSDTGIVYICRFRNEGDDDWYLYLSDAMPTDTNTFNDPGAHLLFYSVSDLIDQQTGFQKMADDILFENLLRFTRQRNGGYYDVYANRRRNGQSETYDNDF